jgi:hypothetical protein
MSVRGEQTRVVVAMSGEDALSRPIGWWLKEADARLDAAFDSALEGTGMDRRCWQVLASLSRGSTRRADLVSALASFDPPAVVEDVVDRLSARGWIEDSADVLVLTPAGVDQHEGLAHRVDGVRQQVGAALPHKEYVALVDLLARLVTALPPAI